jgi:hypothetical protein
MEIDLAWLKAVVARHLPDFHLHPDDAYLPCSAEFFMTNSELRARAPDGAVTVLAPRGALAGPLLLESQAAHPSHRLWMELHPSARPGQPLEEVNDVPVYAVAKGIIKKGDPCALEALEITYITVFAYNGDYPVVPGLIHTGAHDGDVEHLTARVHPETGDLLAMWYNAHRSRDGQWVPAAAVPRCPATGRPLAYIAKHGHGNYPAPGTILRHFFLGNDRCSANGPVWRPRRVVLLPHRADASGAAHRHALHCTRSRGSSLGSEVSEVAVAMEAVGGSIVDAAATADAAAAAADAAAAAHSNTTASPSVPSTNSDADRSPEVIHDDPCEWVFFRGLWGETEAPICQSWYHVAETPVSRTSLQRIALHLWPETDSV